MIPGSFLSVPHRIPWGRCRRGSDGFTLVEVVVALILVGVMTAVTFETLSASRKLSIKADATLDAARILQNLVRNRTVIDGLLLQGKEENEISGDIPEESAWSYWMRMTPLQLMAEGDRDPVDVASVMRMEICAVHHGESGEKRYCVERWFRNDDVLAQIGGLQPHAEETKSRKKSAQKHRPK